ncbi:MAG: 3'-5' exonuclease domain-containing protein 2 [Bacteroidaceae bacterium]|nr:3'-5' exonuclease domain-containing protein 2 [Bacteroidaceae bacterium]
MSKTLVSRFDKSIIPTLPRAVFEGRIIVIQSELEAKKAVRFLLSQPILGFDTETRPNFRKGGMNKVALLQVSCYDTCFLFRLNQMGLPQCLLDLLASTDVQKIGLSWHDDVTQLRRRNEEVVSEGFLELQTYSSEFGITDMSLAKLYANVFGQKISKTQQLSNWEADVLSEAQKQYAATDAWACIRLYEELHRLEESGDYTLEVIPEPEPPQRPEGEAPKADKPKPKRRKKSGRKKPVAAADNSATPKAATRRKKPIRKKKTDKHVQEPTTQEG